MPKRNSPPKQPAAVTSPPPPVSRRAALLASGAISLILLVIFHATMLRTVVDQDSGELVSAAHVLGIAHPTGYPLWVLLGRLFDYLPLGGASAYRVGMLSGLSAALAGGVVTLLGIELSGILAGGMAAGLAGGLWFPVWSQAVRAEVYALSALLSALAVMALVRWDRARTMRRAVVFALAVGFVAMHHRTAMFAVLPALLVAAMLTRPRRARLYLAGIGAALAPFLCYAYLPLRAAARPPVNWTNPSTPERFLDHMLGRQYTHFALTNNHDHMLQLVRQLAPEVFAATTPLALALAALGLPLIGWGWWHWRKEQPLVAWSLLAGNVLLCRWVLGWGETSDLKVFLQPLGIFLPLCGVIGLAALSRAITVSRLRHVLPAVAGGAICLALLSANWARSDQSNIWVHRDRWAATLQQMAPNAIFVSDNDIPSFATMYLQTVEERRKDVTVIRVVPLPTDWYIGLIDDSLVREATRKAWTETQYAMAQQPEQNPWIWKWNKTAVFAYLLARELEGKRPVYSLHGLRESILPEAPYFVSLTEDLVDMRSSRPGLTRRTAQRKPRAEFAGGLELVDFTLDRKEVATGDLLGFRATWHTAGTLPPAQFGVHLRPLAMRLDRFDRTLLSQGRFVQGFPLLQSFDPATPMASDMVFEQPGQLIIPSNAPSGEYLVSVGMGQPYAVTYEEVTEVARIRVRAQPRPGNGP